jgi:hypothetical protein
MANLLAEGIWPCTILSGTSGEDDRKMLIARINVLFDDGPNKGRTGTYEDKIDARSALYVSRSCKAVGWNGKSIATLAADIDAWIKKTGGKSTAEVKHIPIKNGKRAGEIWDKINSIGRGPRPLNGAGADTLSDADAALRAAMQADGAEPAEDDVPHVASVPDDQIPF